MNKSTEKALIIGIAIIIAVAILAQNANITLPNFNPNIIVNPSPSPSPTPTPTPTPQPQPENARKPTVLNAFVSPNPCTMGWWVDGTVTSNGYNYPIKIIANHLTTGTSQTLTGFLGPDGQFALTQQLNTPGYWTFQAMTEDGSVTSNLVELTCVGVKVDPSKEFYSRLIDDSITFTITSYIKNANGVLTAKSGAGTKTVGNFRTDSHGLATLTANLDSYNTVDWEFDATVGGQSASTYKGTCWVRVSR